jgi:flagella basal body P-ring formation protein FlgA
MHSFFKDTRLPPAGCRGTRAAPRVWLAALLLPLLYTSASAATVDAHAIDQAAEAAVRALASRHADTLLLTPAPLDPRLRLTACDRPLDAAITNDGEVRRQTTVAVRCAGRIHWTIYTSVGVESLAQVLVARTALPRDATLTASDFTTERRRVPGLADDYVADVARIAGQRLQRPIGAGQPLPADALAPAPLIRRGQQVVLLAHGDGIEVRAAAIALSDGRAADVIRVQNLASQRIVEGVVRSASVVEAPL